MRSLITIIRTLISAVPGGALPGVFHEVQHDAGCQREQRHEAEAMLRHNSSSVDWTGCAEEPPRRIVQRRACVNRGRHEQPGLKRGRQDGKAAGAQACVRVRVRECESLRLRACL